MSTVAGAGVRVRALAKVNLTLRVLGTRADGYHELRTVFQSIAVHDTLTLTPARGRFVLECDDPRCPADESNLVWRAARRLWRADRRRNEPSGVRVHLRKRIPMQAGLGGGSSDAAAALRALAAMWQVDIGQERLREIASGLGADVAFFLEGGTVLGVDCGDELFPLVDRPRAFVVLVVPPFGVSTKDAYAWWDEANRGRPARPPAGRTWANDLQVPVARRYPDVARLCTHLRRLGASYAAMSGSGSAVFGLFESRERAGAAAAAMKAFQRMVMVTETIDRKRYARLSRPLRMSV